MRWISGFLAFLFWYAAAPAAQSREPTRSVALTFDDLPFVYSGHEGAVSAGQRALTTDDRIQRVLRRYSAPATGFVNESKLGALGAAGPQILESWNRGPFELGNHGFSHADTNQLTIAEIEREIVQGERISKPLALAAGRSLRFFRFPFNRLGETEEKRVALEQLLSRLGYQLAASTIDTSDFLFDRAHERATNQNDIAMRRRIEEAYLGHTDQQIEYYSDLNQRVLGYRPPDIVVLHLNSLNAAVADRLLKLFKDRRYRFVSLAKAQSDPAYRRSPAYATKFGPMWGYRWAHDRQIKVDGHLEKEPPEWVAKYAAGK